MAQRKGERASGSLVAAWWYRMLCELGAAETLLEVVELTGGSAFNQPTDAFLKGRRQSGIAVETWPWLAGLGAFLMIPGVALWRPGPGEFARVGRWPFEGRRRAPDGEGT